MRTINRLAVSSAVGLFTACGAQAADLPVKAKAVEYVKICSTYGAGFYYVPGTDTCVKIGGYSRQDATLNGNGPFESPSWVGNSGQANRLRNYYVLRARENINIDTRTATEYGLLRTYYEGTFQYTSGTDASSGVSLDMPRAFIQFAGFMFGRTVSQFDSPWSGYPGNFGSFVLGGYDDQTGINLAAYTADFGTAA